jgi:biotin carboxyl carrier protein
VKLEALLRGAPRTLELRRNGHRYEGLIGDRSFEAEVEENGRACLLVRVQGRSFEVTWEKSGSAFVLDLGTREVTVEIPDPLRSLPADRLRGDGREDLRAAMPGRVTRVKVAVGDAVVKGQGLLVVEAMKMENEVRAPREGRVVAVGVIPGQAVETGALLVSVE